MSIINFTVSNKAKYATKLKQPQLGPGCGVSEANNTFWHTIREVQQFVHQK